MVPVQLCNQYTLGIYQSLPLSAGTTKTHYHAWHFLKVDSGYWSQVLRNHTVKNIQTKKSQSLTHWNLGSVFKTYKWKPWKLNRNFFVKIVKNKINVTEDSSKTGSPKRKECTYWVETSWEQRMNSIYTIPSFPQNKNKKRLEKKTCFFLHSILGISKTKTAATWEMEPR